MCENCDITSLDSSREPPLRARRGVGEVGGEGEGEGVARARRACPNRGRETITLRLMVAFWAKSRVSFFRVIVPATSLAPSYRAPAEIPFFAPGPGGSPCRLSRIPGVNLGFYFSGLRDVTSRRITSCRGGHRDPTG